MSSPAQDAHRDELVAAQTLVIGRLTGWRHFAVLPQGSPTHAIVAEQIALYEQGLAAIEATLQGMDLLDAWGYPSMPSVKVTPDIYHDLTSDRDAQTAALESVTPVQVAAHLHPSFGESLPKEDAPEEGSA